MPDAQTDNPDSLKLRQDCWDRALHTYGTGVIFERRSRRLGRLLRVLNFIGIGVPVAVGGAVLAFRTNQAFVSVVIAIAGALLLAQLIWSTWAVVASWDDRRKYAIESMNDNFRLASAYGQLAEYPPNDITHRMDVLAAETASRESQDYQQDLKSSEKRRGMCAALVRYQRECVGCKQTPKSADYATTCEVCGNFGFFARRKG